MQKEQAQAISAQTISEPSLLKDEKETSILTDLKYLFKGLVLVLNVMPVIIGFWLAVYITGGTFSAYLDTFFLTVVGSTFLMAGALSLNNWYEVDLDRVMKRTLKRPTVTGNIPLHIVLTIGVSCSVFGLVVLMFTTWETTIYAFIGWFTYVVLYTFWSKRKYTLNTIIGSVSGAVTPLIGWAAIEPAFHIVPIILFIILFIWQVPHTFAIAIKRYDEYKAAKVPMLPVVYGFDFTKRQIFIYILCLLPLPYFLAMLGTTFMVVATILNIGWVFLAIRGFFMEDVQKWAKQIFIYSLNYLTILFLMMILVTLPNMSL
ncbi:MAG TPA: heme o synthase [Bacillota bacterium]|nr:heme o synthase [Bacillota bacterium]